MQSQVPVQPGMVIPTMVMVPQQQMPFAYASMPAMVPQQQMRPGMPGIFPQQVAPMAMFANPQILIDPLAMMNLGGRPYTQGGAQNTAGNKQRKKEQLNALPSLYVSNLPKENFLDLDLYKFF